MTASTPTDRVIYDARTVMAAQGEAQTLGRLIPASIRLLAEGEPVSPARIAEASGVPLEQAESALRGVGDIEWTADGRVEGFGLTRRPTQHRFRVGATDLYTWCAMDTLIFTALLERPVQIESPDGATGAVLRLETDGRRVIAADPPSIVVSWFFDPGASGLRASICQFGHFFASRQSAATWAEKYPQGGVLTLDEALEAARAMVADTFGLAAGASGAEDEATR
jgi:alkylmercury lyase